MLSIAGISTSSICSCIALVSRHVQPSNGKFSRFSNRAALINLQVCAGLRPYSGNLVGACAHVVANARWPTGKRARTCFCMEFYMACDMPHPGQECSGNDFDNTIRAPSAILAKVHSCMIPVASCDGVHDVWQSTQQTRQLGCLQFAIPCLVTLHHDVTIACFGRPMKRSDNHRACHSVHSVSPPDHVHQLCPCGLSGNGDDWLHTLKRCCGK